MNRPVLLLILLSATGALASPKEELCDAAHANDTAKLEKLTARGGAYAKLGYPLFCAIDTHAVAVVEWLLAHDAPVDEKGEGGFPPMHAVEYQLYEARKHDEAVQVFRLIAAKRHDVELVEWDGSTAFLRAVAKGRADIAQLWLDAGARVDARNKHGDNAVHLAVPHADVIAFLVRHHVDVGLQNNDKETPLHRAMNGAYSSADRLATVDALVTAKAPLEVKNKNNETPLLTQIMNHELDLPVVRRLVDAGADVTATAGRDNITPLHVAVGRNDVDLVKLLLGHHAPVDAQDAKGMTPLMSAHRVAVAELLLAAGANVNARRKDGWTPIFVSFDMDVVLLLINRGADINYVAPDGTTALMRATKNRGQAVVELLVARKADVKRTDAHGMTALHFAMQPADYGLSDPTTVAGLLVAAGADVNALNGAGETPLMIAATIDQPEAIRFLRDHGANPNLRDAKGRTALDRARRKNERSATAELDSWTRPADPRFAYLSSRRITPAELDDLTDDELLIARNEIYARRGHAFKHADLAAYFAKQPWYHADPGFSEDSISDVERGNIRAILAAEKARSLDTSRALDQ